MKLSLRSDDGVGWTTETLIDGEPSVRVAKVTVTWDPREQTTALVSWVEDHCDAERRGEPCDGQHRQVHKSSTVAEFTLDAELPYEP
jgi:hypothetical protein